MVTSREREHFTARCADDGVHVETRWYWNEEGATWRRPKERRAPSRGVDAAPPKVAVAGQPPAEKPPNAAPCEGPPAVA